MNYQKEYRRKNREKVQEADRKRKTILRGQRKDFSPRDWFEVLSKHGFYCFYCKKEIDDPEPEHKIPLTRGGVMSQENIVPSCHSCNCRKNDRTVDEYREFLIAIGETPLF